MMLHRVVMLSRLIYQHVNLLICVTMHRHIAMVVLFCVKNRIAQRSNRLQTIFLIVYTKVDHKIIPVLYLSVKNTAKLIDQSKEFFEDTLSHSDVIVTGTDLDNCTTIIPSSLMMNEEDGLISNFSLLYTSGWI